MKRTPPQPEIDLLRAEIEILVQERARLLKIVGAAAVFVANMDVGKLPKHVLDAADVLATSINDLPKDSLLDALESVGAEVTVDSPERRKQPR